MRRTKQPARAEYTHGGSAGKNLWLLLRAVLNLLAFAAFWTGLCHRLTAAPYLPAAAGAVCLWGGGALLLACLVGNLLLPFARRGGN